MKYIITTTGFYFLSIILLFSQQHFTIINGQKYRTCIKGKGNITALIESGMSDSIEIWGSIPDSIATFAKVFYYDRADIGRSDSSRLERTIPNMILELRLILEKENLKPPYVLVGHSMGTMIFRYFASEYPEEVIGILLLDPAPELYWNNMSKRKLKKYINGGTEWYETKFEKRYHNEWHQLIRNLTYMDSLLIDPDLPIILVSATAWGWYNLHSEIIKDYKNAKHIELEGEHHIFKQHPEEIISYIRELVNN